MKPLLLLLYLLLTGLSLVQAQTKDWININPPQAGVVGKLVRKGTMVGNQLPASLLKTVAGPDTYRQEATSHFTINLPVSKYDNFKFSRVHIDTMVVDYLSDEAMFGNPNYETNTFVYKAIRAKQVTYFFKIENTSTIKIDEVLPPNIITEISKIIPNASIASIKPSRVATDTIAITIKNPQVYFRALAINLVPSCKDCRQSFKTDIEDGNNYILDLADISTYSSVIKVPQGTQPMFKLYVEQAVTDVKKLKLYFEIDREFLRANNDFITSPIEVPVKEFTLKDNLIRRFSFSPIEYYIGTMSSGVTRALWSDMSLHQPIYVSVAAEQIDESRVKLMTKYSGATFASKVEYTPYKYKIYRGRLQ
ncbi:hypothetical protein [Hymenobacter sp. UYP22]|uniref:hypothetical protein n=1 Tax=Hymenobacter sp. UYP22 TaxID=3156348 RepID=UPI0033955777